MTYGTKNYGAVASAYGPLTRNMPNVKTATGQQDGDNQWKQKQKVLHGSLLEYTKRMDKIKQARMAISKSKEQGRLSSVPQQRRHFKMVLPGLDQLEHDALSLTNKFMSQAQFQSASSAADKVIERSKETLPSEGVKSSIFSNEVQERSKASPNSFKQNWRVLKDVKVRNIPVLKTKDGVVYSTVCRPAKINQPQTAETFEDTRTTIVKLDEQGIASTNVTNENFRKYHPGILPMPGMKGPYKSKVTLHVSLPQMEREFDGEPDEENDTNSCSIDLPNDSQSSSRVQTPNPTKIDTGQDISSATLQNKEKFEAVLSNDPMDDRNGATRDKEKPGDVAKSLKGSDKHNDRPNEKGNVKRHIKNENAKTISPLKKISVLPPTSNLPRANKHGEKNHYPCADCPVCKAEMESSESNSSVLKKNDKPLPNIKSSSGQDSSREKNKVKRSSLQQITLPGGVMKLGKVTYHRTYKINVRPVPPHMKQMVGGVSSELTLHDSFADAVKGTDVLKEAERTIRFEKNRKENQERRKRFTNETKPMQPLCRHGRFVQECYTCRAVEEIRQRLNSSYSRSEQQYQWNLLSKHERHLTQNGSRPMSNVKPPLRKNAPYRLSAISKPTDTVHAAEDSNAPPGEPGGRVITEKEEGRANPQGLLPKHAEGNIDENCGNVSNENEELANKKVRFAEERIYDPMRGSYRQSNNSNNEQMLLSPLKN
ncbi:uncharacterized protein LOC129262380 [Lytechinus pictus]|uniref:uncharacterized protein LOC129262380 n=1 Tax=Lytechinus pictus TaxID=7653 RepID=UPI0030B9BBAD